MKLEFWLSATITTQFKCETQNVVFLSYITDTDDDMTFSVLHIKGNRPVIEPTVDHSGSHVKWNVTSLSPVGPIIQTSQAVEHHGVVLVYKQLTTDNNSYSFHVYLGTNSASDIKVSGVLFLFLFFGF